MAKESIEKQRKPFESIVALDRLALPRIYAVGITQAYKEALCHQSEPLPPLPRAAVQDSLFRRESRRR